MNLIYFRWQGELGTNAFICLYTDKPINVGQERLHQDCQCQTGGQTGYSPDVCEFGMFLLRKGIFKSLCPGIKPVSECKKAYLKAVVRRKKTMEAWRDSFHKLFVALYS